MRVSFLAVVVALLGVFVSACTGSFTSPSPTPTNSLPPLTQDLEINGSVSASVSSVPAVLGTIWSVSFRYRCQPGTRFGVVFQKADGSTKSGNGVDLCGPIDNTIVIGTEFREQVDQSLMRFSGGDDLKLRLATASNLEEWKAGNYKLQSVLDFTIQFR